MKINKVNIVVGSGIYCNIQYTLAYQAFQALDELFPRTQHFQIDSVSISSIISQTPLSLVHIAACIAVRYVATPCEYCLKGLREHTVNKNFSDEKISILERNICSHLISKGTFYRIKIILTNILKYGNLKSHL